jgi:tryptophan-rich sensory protein
MTTTGGRSVARQAAGLALVVLIALWMAIVVTTVLFFRRSIVAGALLLPYLAWCTFAGALNAAIWRMNP